MAVYLIVSMLALVASIFVCFDYVFISSASMVPLALIAISIFQAFIFKSLEKDAGDYTSETAYSTSEIDYDARQRGMKYQALSKLAVIPLLALFIIYFGSVWKFAAPILIYCFSYFPTFFIVKFGKNR